ncbi:methyl-accepting chemotaxis protein [Pseudomonas sp. GV071]|jgi:methyl-accepting chemotaxis protein|uniref:methyl-accepting chemotaxis protein n=1 Tax=Pseudomonas sp. GV071 TaxID=2135754 RepID=UPI000D34A0DB|nr:methyl-accepting chemotaxis protein [Pseudomonas sp. GV071]PTQ72806.1 methyl-accepting chemotaxis protein [Pseudomonas sp. GV071]
MNLRSLNIAPRAGIGFALVALLVFFLGSFALLQMASMREEAAEVDQEWMPSVLALGNLSESALRLRTITLRLLLIREPQALKDNEARAEQLKRDMQEAQARYEAMIDGGEETTLYQAFKTAQSAYLQEQAKVMELSRQNKLDEALVVVSGVMNAQADAMAKALRALSEYNTKGVNAAAASSSATFYSARTWVIITMVVAAIATVLLALLLTRSIVNPLNRALRSAEIVAAGDLTERIQVDGSDEPARLLAALHTMQQSLRTTIQSIADSSNQLASASEELSAVTEDSTRGLHQQNDEIEQAATAVNEMTTAVEEVARNAVITSEASRESDRTTQRGREQVQQTVNSISSLADDVTTSADQVLQLADKVRDISQVLDVIRSIAEQTNLLALNAAIEAARAGEAGRGFAVVADEVRALAHRTQQSTQEIEQMVGGIRHGTDQAVSAMQNSNERARSTLEVAKAAGGALDEIAVAISAINERNLVIASASEEQAQVAREVDRNLTNIRDLSLQSSAGANETAAASQDLSRLAVELNGMVARFRV